MTQLNCHPPSHAVRTRVAARTRTSADWTMAALSDTARAAVCGLTTTTGRSGSRRLRRRRHRTTNTLFSSPVTRVTESDAGGSAVALDFQLVSLRGIDQVAQKSAQTFTMHTLRYLCVGSPVSWLARGAAGFRRPPPWTQLNCQPPSHRRSHPRRLPQARERRPDPGRPPRHGSCWRLRLHRRHRPRRRPEERER